MFGNLTDFKLYFSVEVLFSFFPRDNFLEPISSGDLQQLGREYQKHDWSMRSILLTIDKEDREADLCVYEGRLESIVLTLLCWSAGFLAQTRVTES